MLATPHVLRHVLARVADGASLSETAATEAFDIIMSGAASDAEIAGFLMALRVRGETAAELTGAVRAMRALMHRVDAPPGAVDLCGTGGDGRATLNVSTAAAFVAAGAGAVVAKHGNSALSSRSGATDVLAALGLDPSPDPADQSARLAALGLAFLHAPHHHPALRHAAAARRALGTRTLLNLAGPLCNPAGVDRQLVGVYHRRWLRPVAEALAALGTERAWIVHGDGIDEITLAGPTDILSLDHGAIEPLRLTPEDFGLPRAPVDAVTGGDPAHNARAVEALLAGAPGPYRDIVRLNAAAALLVAGLAPDLRSGIDLATAAIDDGRAAAALTRARAWPAR